MRLMAPTPSIQYKGHYKSFFEEFDNEYPMFNDIGQPSAAKNDLRVCDKCPSYRFTSKTEKKRHDGLFHRRQKTTPMSATEKHFECKFSNCGELFGSQPSLSRHQLLSKHRKRDQQAVNPNIRFNRPTSKKKKKQKRTVSEVIRSKVARFSSTEEEEVAECAAKKCKIGEDKDHDEGTRRFKWLACDYCEAWFHAFCVNKGNLSKTEMEKIDYTCDQCEANKEQLQASKI